MQINQLPTAASLNLLDKFAVDAIDGVTKSITASQLRDLIRANSYGAPLEASTVADMTDTSKVYVYTGNETGYTNGNWYYYDGTAWVSGGVYNSVAVTTDKTLLLANVAADAKATGEAIYGMSADITTVDGKYMQITANILSDLAPNYDDSLHFPVSEGQYCVRAERFYKANQDIPTPEAWNSAHWDRVNIGDELYGVGGNIEVDIEGLSAAISAESSTREAAVAELNSGLGNLNDLTTDDKSSAVAAINEVNDRFIEGVDEAVVEWLNDHPEATTTVEDGSLTENKFSTPLKAKALWEYSPKPFLNLDFLGRVIKSDSYKSAQGFMARIEQGILYVYICWYNYASGDAQRSYIEKINANTGEVIKTSSTYYMHHSNDMCTDGNYIYVCGYNKNAVYKFDFTTLELLDTISTDIYLQSLTYDYDREVFYGFTSYGNFILYELTNNFQTSREVYRYTPHYGVESIEYFNNMVLFNENAPNSETIISVEDWTQRGVGLFNEYMSGYYPIGEAQGISIYNSEGDYICIGKPRQRSINSNSYEIGQGIASIGRGNILNNQTYKKRYMSASVIDFTGNANVNNNVYVYKPDGTVANPFYNCGDVIICLDAPTYKPTQITLRSNMPDEFAVIGKTLYVDGGGYTVPNASIDNCNGVINNVSFTSGMVSFSQITLNNVSGLSFKMSRVNVIDSNYTVYNSTNSSIDYPLYTYIGNATTQTATISFPTNTPRLLLFVLVNSGVFLDSFILPARNAIDGTVRFAGADIAVTTTEFTVTNNQNGEIRIFGIW